MEQRELRECPVCTGAGNVWIPFYDYIVESWEKRPVRCPVCDGKRWLDMWQWEARFAVLAAAPSANGRAGRGGAMSDMTMDIFDMPPENAVGKLYRMSLDDLMAFCRTCDRKYDTGYLTSVDEALWSVATALIEVRNAEERLQWAQGNVAKAAMAYGGEYTLNANKRSTDESEAR